MLKKCFLLLCLLPLALSAQTSSVSYQDISNYKQWGWNAVVMQNGIITLATVPSIGGRVMQYDLGSLSSVMVNPTLFGKTYTPAQNGQWYNFGGFKTWPAPQSVWPGTWPPPPTLDYGMYTIVDSVQTNDSVAVSVLSLTEKWIAPNIRFLRKATIYPGTSRVKMEQTIINNGASDVTWGVWSIVQSIVNHPGKTDYQNFWAYFPLNPKSVWSSGDTALGSSKAWKGEISPGTYGVQFSPDNAKIFADPDRGWIAYANLSDTVVFARTFPIFDGMDYPDGGARVSVYVSSPASSSAPAYMEVEVKGPLVNLAAGGGQYTFTENWWAAKVEGPVLDVDSVGAVAHKLSYSKSPEDLVADYGVFYDGTANLAFVDLQGKVISEGKKYTVSPLEEFHLEEMVTIPDSAKSVEVQVHDSSGAFIGILEAEDISQLPTNVGVTAQKVASEFRLFPNYPNPFNGGTVIRIYSPRVARGSIRIYDILGREVAQLGSGMLTAGEHRYNWNPENLSSGVYIAKLEANGIQMTQKMIYLR